jgi:hypothetical protein
VLADVLAPVLRRDPEELREQGLCRSGRALCRTPFERRRGRLTSVLLCARCDSDARSRARSASQHQHLPRLRRAEKAREGPRGGLRLSGVPRHQSPKSRLCRPLSDGETRTRTGDNHDFQSWSRLSLTATDPSKCAGQRRTMAKADRRKCGLLSPIWVLRRRSVPNEIAPSRYVTRGYAPTISGNASRNTGFVKRGI